MILPNFLIIGAAKAGTTSLYHYLRQHPQVFMSAVKEVNFFAYAGQGSRQFPVRSLEEYGALFREVRAEKAVGEASPRYLSHPEAAERIRRTLPEVRLVASLRDPVERAYSGYLMQVRKGRERRPPEACFERGDVYVEGGFYGEQLRRFYDRFDSGRIHVLLFEELGGRARATLRALFDFLEVDPDFAPDTSVRHNVGGYPARRWLVRLLASRWLRETVAQWAPAPVQSLGRRLRERNLTAAPALPPQLRQRLLELYRPDIERLQGLVGRDLSAWLAAPGAGRGDAS